MISAIITAAGRNRRMEEDQEKLGLKIQNKLLLDLQGKPIIIKTIENVKKTGVEDIIVVLGHFSTQIEDIINKYCDNNIKIIFNHQKDVQLSQTLLNGVKNVNDGLCLCVAADQPTVSIESMKKLLQTTLKYQDRDNRVSPERDNMVTILAREKTGELKSTKGLGMPFVCHLKLLKKYLPSKNDNLNPILGEMLDDGVVFYGIPPKDELELININHWNDYIKVKQSIKKRIL
jgi:molybdenum cofactor cytidylyltransferase